MMKRFSLLACVSTFLLPLTTFAAAPTPQQVLDRGLMNTVQQQRQAERSSVDFDIRYDTAVLKKDLYGSGNEHMRMRAVLSSDTFVRGAVDADGIFSLRVPQFEYKTDKEPLVKVPNPFNLEVRLVNHVVYIRVSDVAPALLAQLPATTSPGESDLRALIGAWIKIDPAELGADMQDFSMLSTGITDATKDANLKDLRALLSGSVFQVVSVESRTKNSAGDQMMRLRIRLNPTFIDRLVSYQDAQAVKMGGVKMTAKQRAAAKKELQTALAPLKLVAVVNATKMTLDRVEAVYVKTDSIYRYDYRNGKEKKYYNGKSTMDIRFGISLQGITDRSVPIPEGAISLKTLVDQWKQAVAIPETNPEEPVQVLPPLLNDPFPPATTVTPVDGSDHIRGNAQAPVTVIVYSDYECPFCQQHAPNIQRLLMEFPQDVRVVYRNYPLSFHPHAQEAAEAAECVGRVAGSSAFWSMHDQLFAQGSNLGAVSYTSLATQLGVNPQSFVACMNAHESVGKVNQDVMTGNQSGVNGTPATFINGVLISGAVPYESLRQAVQQALPRR
jgi:protein-disulfide isomerase